MESPETTSSNSPNVPPRKQVGFARVRPTLIIPPPLVQEQLKGNPYTANSLRVPNTTSGHQTPTSVYYKRKQSVFNFEQFYGIRDFTKSGLGFGEKCAYWLYNKVRRWSKKWFTHIFLTIVLAVYTIGGALIFEYIEGENEKTERTTLRTLRYDLLEEIHNIRHLLCDDDPEFFNGNASKLLKTYEKDIVNHHAWYARTHEQGETKIWTFWNAVVFCGTVYTSIAIHDPNSICSQCQKRIPVDQLKITISLGTMHPDEVSRNDEQIKNIQRFVTEEQVLSANIARKRRNLTRKRSGAQKRDQTPIKDANTTDDEQIEARPKTPERRRRKKHTDEGESTSFLAKITMRGRQSKKPDKEAVKRSQSAPHAFTQEELIESFRRAQLLEYSEDEKPAEKPTLKPEVRNYIKQRKQSRASSIPRSSRRIIEILDPKTSNIVTTKAQVLEEFSLRHLFSVLNTYTIRELCRCYGNYRNDMKAEVQRIRVLRNRCFCELFLIMLLCGLGGFLFRFIEGRFEFFYKCGVKRVKRDFIELLWTKSHNLREDDWKSLARNKLRNFEEELHTAHEAGMKSYSGQRSWSFLNSVVYCLTVITTIGYGHLYPETVTGKALTIVYAIVGMPLFLLALTDFGKLFTRCIKFLWSFVRRVYYTGSCRRARKTAHVEEFFKGAQMMYEIATFRRPSAVVDAEAPNPEVILPQVGEETPTTPAISNFEIDDEFNLPISLAIFILVLYIFFGATVYCVWEHWNFFDSFYFVFISMSTIGFGDMVPNDAVIMIVSIVYLVFGLALMSMCINVVQEKLSDTFKQASTKIGATMGITVAEEDGSITVIPADAIELPKIHEVVQQNDRKNVLNVQVEPTSNTDNDKDV